MKWTGLNELREKYLNFFESKGHLKHKSFPLVPINDKSLLLINAGMAPLKRYFTGEEEPPRHRMTTCQKCIRTPDIERIGYTARHGTFFEMLGNFSFGDYFKTEAISWAWEFCTEVLELPKDKLWVTIYENDNEAFELWNKNIGVPAERIVRLGKEDNFWEIGSGPCGPCSEIYFDRGLEFGCGSDDCKPGCDCDRFMEFWNLVFTQFDGDGEGGYTPLANPNIDTGMGLERLACLMQGVNNLFEVDTIQNIMTAISEKAGVKYGENKDSDISLRIITDHIRSTTFLVCDGVVPTNEGRGYVLRRLLRRAARHGRILGIKGTFLTDIVAVVAKENLTAYPELTEKLDYIQKIIGNEENKFAQTIDSGLALLNDLIDETKNAGSTTLSGEGVFKLNDTYGFPIDLTREIASEAGLSIDEDGFKKCLNEQKERSRAATAALGDFGWVGESFDFLEGVAETVFTGYDELATEAKVVKIVDPETNSEVDNVTEGKVLVILDKTPFYGEGGGQVGDRGSLKADNLVVKVNDTKKHDGVYMHVTEVKEGMISVGDTVTASVCAKRRGAIGRNHSCVHLLQAALRQILGNHVEQAGSYVDDKRLRFDFSHFAALTADELKAVEDLVNEKLMEALDITVTETDVDTARSMGAMALFGEKYGKVVRVVKMGDFSTELCGGTHIDNTAKAGLFKIIAETSVAAGVRRIEGTSALGVLELLKEKENLILDTAKELKSANVNEIANRAASLQTELKSAKHEIEALNGKIAASRSSDLMSKATQVGAVKVVAAETKDITVDVARTMSDNLKAEDASVVVVLSTYADGKLNFVCACGKDAVAAGAHAGNIVRNVAAICDGKGGGRPDSAVAGAKDANKVAEAIAQVTDIVAGMLK